MYGTGQPESQCEDFQKQLDASREFFHAIVTRSADGIVVLDPDGVICFVNPAAEDFLGMPMEDLLGTEFGVPVADGESTDIDVPQPDGRTRTAELRVAATTWQGRPAFLATLRDVTQRKHEEARVAEAVRQRDEFLAILSHELRNPIAAITNAARVATRTDDPGQSLAVIQRQCGHVARLLDDLLDVSRVSRGKLELRREHVAIQRIVAEAVESTVGTASDHGHRFDVALDDEPIVVDGDPARLVQVVANLLGNAIKYAPRGSRITVGLRASGDTAELSVTDDGPGIAAADRESIFEPFVQLQPHLHGSDAETSMGVGLALVRFLVELHGGSVEVRDPREHTGSEFVVRLPRVDAPLEQQPRPRSRRVEPRRILLVEDNVDLRTMLAELLQFDGHTVITAADGLAAIGRLNVESVDVALVDIGLPGIDGYEVARRIRRCPCGERLLLVALTGFGLPEDIRRAEEAGFDHHLVKPVDFARLNRVLAESPNRTVPISV